MFSKSLFFILLIITIFTLVAAQGCPMDCQECDDAGKCTQCEDHYYVNDDGQCSKCMRGSPADECKYDDDDDHHDDDDDHHDRREEFIEMLEKYEFYIEGILTFDIDIEEFQKEDGQDIIVKKIAYFLEINPEQVVVKDIYEGSTVFVFAVLCDDEEKIKTYGQILEDAQYPYPVLDFESSQPQKTEELLEQMESRRIGMIVGIVIGSVAFVVILGIILWCFCIKKRRQDTQIGSGSGSVDLNNDKNYQMTNNGNEENNYYQKELQS